MGNSVTPNSASFQDMQAFRGGGAVQVEHGGTFEVMISCHSKLQFDLLLLLHLNSHSLPCVVVPVMFQCLDCNFFNDAVERDYIFDIGYGGAVNVIENSSLLLYRCTISHNSATTNGGYSCRLYFHFQLNTT